jgi:hypothetical protein
MSATRPLLRVAFVVPPPQSVTPPRCVSLSLSLSLSLGEVCVHAGALLEEAIVDACQHTACLLPSHRCPFLPPRCVCVCV